MSASHDSNYDGDKGIREEVGCVQQCSESEYLVVNGLNIRMQCTHVICTLQIIVRVIQTF